MIKQVRSQAHQLIEPVFEDPKELVSWMGAIQAQDFQMVKWSVGVRLKSPSLQKVEQALQSGDIIRTHILRPTWHLVAKEDLRWMLKLTASRIQKAHISWAKGWGITQDDYSKCNRLMESFLTQQGHLSKQEIAENLVNAGISLNHSYAINTFLMYAELEGVICSGIEKGKKATYALLEERVPSVPELHKEEALARLATQYFQSHSPATIQDFSWWSGLSVRESKEAIQLIKERLQEESFGENTYYIDTIYLNSTSKVKGLHLLPPYDEYLISYKDRTDVLEKKFYPKAFNNYGIFYPVIFYNGKIVGNWSKVVKKGELHIATSLFTEDKIPEKLLKNAIERYKSFMAKDK